MNLQCFSLKLVFFQKTFQLSPQNNTTQPTATDPTWSRTCILLAQPPCTHPNHPKPSPTSHYLPTSNPTTPWHQVVGANMHRDPTPNTNSPNFWSVLLSRVPRWKKPVRDRCSRRPPSVVFLVSWFAAFWAEMRMSQVSGAVVLFFFFRLGC